MAWRSGSNCPGGRQGTWKIRPCNLPLASRTTLKRRLLGSRPCFHGSTLWWVTGWLNQWRDSGREAFFPLRNANWVLSPILISANCLMSRHQSSKGPIRQIRGTPFPSLPMAWGQSRSRHSRQSRSGYLPSGRSPARETEPQPLRERPPNVPKASIKNSALSSKTASAVGKARRRVACSPAWMAAFVFRAVRLDCLS